MIFSWITSLVGKWPSRAPHNEHLLNTEALLKSLAVERAMADRTGQVLSMVVFTPRMDRDSDRMCEILSQSFRTRLRISDKYGMLDAQRVCAILPSTSAEGAWKVTEDIVLSYPTDSLPPFCEVLCYPSGKLPFPEKAPADGSTDEATRTTHIPSETLSYEDHDSISAKSFANDSLAKPAAPLEAIFLRHTPIGKRLLDIVGASLGILALLPLLPIIAVAIKLTSPGPVFFTQLRSGLGGRPFRMWKFRTMVVDSESQKAALLALNEQDGPAFKIKNDPRITSIGRILRKTSIDELPQLWNVLLGDMSLVGPRPLPCHEAEQCETWQRRRLDVTPGLTCIWQVHGRSVVSFDEWVRMDLQYIHGQSMSEDVKLIALTVPAMLLNRGR